MNNTKLRIIDYHGKCNMCRAEIMPGEKAASLMPKKSLLSTLLSKLRGGYLICEKCTHWLQNHYQNGSKCAYCNIEIMPGKGMITSMPGKEPSILVPFVICERCFHTMP